MRLSHDKHIRLHVTVAEAIRLSIKEACQSKNKEEKTLWDSLDRIWARTSDTATEKIESAVDQAIREVRRGKKAHRRS